MRDLIAAEKFYGYSKKRKTGLCIVIFVIVAGLLTVFPVNLTNLRSTKSKSEIQALLSTFDELYRGENVKGLTALYSGVPDVIAIGAGKSEQYIGHEAIEATYEREFSEFGEIKSVGHKTLSVNIAGDTASLAAVRYITALRKDEVIRRTGRLTAVLKKVHGRWVFIQTHFSFPPE